MGEPLDGIIAKIERADEHIRQLNDEITLLIKSDAYRIVQKKYPDTCQSALCLFGEEPPIKFSIMVGEIVYHLRSALDHLIWQLVLTNGRKPTRWNQFPICDTPEEYKSSIDKRHIQGVPSVSSRK